jgi:putative transposase
MEMQEPFLAVLEQMRRQFDMRVFGYVVMPEHVHVLLNEPAKGDLADAMQMLKTRVSVRARNMGHRIEGGTPFWQARYFDHNVRNHAGFVTQLRYIHRNPVKRGLCCAPEDWPWSSFPAWATGEMGIVEVENEWTAQRRNAERPSRPPALAPEKRREDGAREPIG